MPQEPLLGDVTIPPDVFVRCPDIRYALRQARRCDGCAHFKGLAQRIVPEGAQMPPFKDTFFVRCAFPVVRELYNVEIEAPLA